MPWRNARSRSAPVSGFIDIDGEDPEGFVGDALDWLEALPPHAERPRATTNNAGTTRRWEIMGSPLLLRCRTGGSRRMFTQYPPSIRITFSS